MYRVTGTPQTCPHAAHNLLNHPQQPDVPLMLFNDLHTHTEPCPKISPTLGKSLSGNPEGREETRAYMSSCVPFFAASSAPLWSGGSWAGILGEGCWGWCRKRCGSWSVRKMELRIRIGSGPGWQMWPRWTSYSGPAGGCGRKACTGPSDARFSAPSLPLRASGAADSGAQAGSPAALFPTHWPGAWWPQAMSSVPCWCHRWTGCGLQHAGPHSCPPRWLA